MPQLSEKKLYARMEARAKQAERARLYRQFRERGFTVKCAWAGAKTKQAWDSLDFGDVGPNQDRTLVRLRVMPDECCELDNILGDSYDPKVNPDIPAERLERERQAEIDRINRDGVWGVIGEYRVSADEEWEQADSCWGFVGDDWKNSGYDIDIMQTTLDALEKAQADVCPHCGRARKAK